MGVAVIDEVEQIKTIRFGVLANLSGVKEMAIPDPIGVTSKAGISEAGELDEAVPPGRPDPFGEDFRGVLFAKVTEDHLGHQVHAGPVFLEIVANDTQADGRG